MASNVSQLLWTGGWDSTFRLLDLVLVRQLSVQPHYIVDPGRRSASKELATMDNIRDAIAAISPDASVRILPNIVTDLRDLRPDAEITASFQRLRQAAHLGSQYDWLARYADQRNIVGLELAIHRDDRAHAFVTRQVAPAVPADINRIFGAFEFPLLDRTKRGMRDDAARRGLSHVLDLTWFCFSGNAEPCGVCAPCRYTIQEGLGYRLPIRSRARYYLSRSPPFVQRCVARLLRRFPLTARSAR